MHKRKPKYVTHYTHLDALMASPDKPMPQEKVRHQLIRMWEGLSALESAENPTNEDWRMCSDAVNLMETLIVEMKVCEDADNLLMDAITALSMAWKRAVQGKTLRLDGKGITSVRAILEDYAALLEVLPARTVIMAHIRTERRLQDILRGKRKSHDVTVQLCSS